MAPLKSKGIFVDIKSAYSPKIFYPQAQDCGVFEFDLMNNKYLVTGSAGFIGSALTLRLLERGDSVIGIDNHNSYYDPAIKEARLARHANHSKYIHLRVDLTDRLAMNSPFKV